ncbi:hypothetical protein [Catenovulum maritimum]|uniref:Uncharacterized protein n=1 Tax=Catenovulum maritimum TaxID=1513271 RepID=A0A0J8GWD0_9ALTE|nr:hypothetical protein [Catenovulum maritimum]KMT65594.1 hypothetical protein XM47_07805 [Catenovulum maritimum]
MSVVLEWIAEYRTIVNIVLFVAAAICFVLIIRPIFSWYLGINALAKKVTELTLQCEKNQAEIKSLLKQIQYNNSPEPPLALPHHKETSAMTKDITEQVISAKQSRKSTKAKKEPSISFE